MLKGTFKYNLLNSAFISRFLLVLQNQYFWKIAFMLVTENSTRFVGVTLLLADVVDDKAFFLSRRISDLSSRNGYDTYIWTHLHIYTYQCIYIHI